MGWYERASATGTGVRVSQAFGSGEGAGGGTCAWCGMGERAVGECESLGRVGGGVKVRGVGSGGMGLWVVVPGLEGRDARKG